MPYVNIDDRDKYFPKARTALNPGQLNYQITSLVTQYVREHSATSGLNYNLLNEVMGALSGAQQEFYRRAVVPYESMKIEQNGDMYD